MDRLVRNLALYPAELRAPKEHSTYDGPDVGHTSNPENILCEAS